MNTNAGTWQHSLEHDGRLRTYSLHVPDSLPGQPRPLVIMLHGAGGTATISERATGWAAKGADAGFLVCYPDATRPDPNRPPSFLRNPPFWSAQPPPTGRHSGADDVGFLDRLLDELIAGYGVDARRVYLCGFSNGASMALVAAARLSERIAAVAAVAGKLWQRDLTMRRPVPLIYMTGDADPLNPIDGGPLRSPWGDRVEHPPLRLLIETWTAAIGCPPNPAEHRDEDGVRINRYGPGHHGAEMLVYIIPGCGHVWPGGKQVLAERITGPACDHIDATSVIWRFFSRFALG